MKTFELFFSLLGYTFHCKDFTKFQKNVNAKYSELITIQFIHESKQHIVSCKRVYTVHANQENES